MKQPLNIFAKTTISPARPDRIDCDWAALLEDLTECAGVASANEAYLAAKLNRADSHRHNRGELYWLVLAAITELALDQAGRLVNGAEFRAAGNLLFNPRLKRLYLRGQNRAIYLDRNQGVSEQMDVPSRSSGDRARWLKQNACVVIEEKALIAHLRDSMAASGKFSQAYLNKIDRAIDRITEVFVYLLTELKNGRTIEEHLDSLDSMERIEFQSNLYQPDLSVFYNLIHLARNQAKNRLLPEKIDFMAPAATIRLPRLNYDNNDQSIQ